MPDTVSPPPASSLSSRSYLFVGVVAVATGAFSYRHSLRSLTARTVNSFAQTAKKQHSATMFGGGTGVEVPAEGTPTAAIIFLHGLGDTGTGWSYNFPLEGLTHVRTILPTAASQPVSLNMGYRSPSWFDLHGLDENAPDDEPSVLESVARVNRIIDAQVADGIPSERIVLGGFSQGGALALTTALRSPRKLAGVVALSAWLPLRSQYPAQLAQGAKDAEMFVGHGTADRVVGFAFGQKSAEFVRSLDRKVTFKSYPGLTHSSSAEELEDMRQFIARAVPPS